jgi:predicted amidohydrolase
METAKSLNISILQMGSVLGDVEANIQKVQALVNKELPADTDVLVLPEVWTVGWSCPRFQPSAQGLIGGSVFEFLSSLAKKYNINIIGGSYIVKDGEKYYNLCPVFDRCGNLVATYSKNHLYSYYGCDEDKYITAGDNLVMVELDGVKFGLTICYDIRFPEVYRAYAKAGADVLVNCAAWGSKKPIPWEVMTKSRAVENQCYMVALTQSGDIENGEQNLGESRIIDYKGEELVTITSGEGIVCTKIDLEDMYDFRQKSPTINDIKDNYEVKILCEKY